MHLVPGIFEECKGCNPGRVDICTLYTNSINRAACPCSKCLVKSMCEGRCEERIEIYFLTNSDSNFIWRKERNEYRGRKQNP
jgi:hypothetical protein